VSADLVRQLGVILDTTEMREVRAHNAAAAIRSARDYRWVGIYDVDDEDTELIGHTGAQARVDVHAPASGGLSGLNGKAIASRETVVADGAAVVPILGAETGIVIGTLDVESGKPDAFTDEDKRFLETVAQALMPLFE
jgi:putative methionine-R-sulfoxide reductase with GAF domain